jgi:hypothetical protein
MAVFPGLTYQSTLQLCLATGEYLRHLVYDKEVREYSTWLANVADFVSGKK